MTAKNQETLPALPAFIDDRDAAALISRLLFRVSASSIENRKTWPVSRHMINGRRHRRTVELLAIAIAKMPDDQQNVGLGALCAEYGDRVVADIEAELPDAVNTVLDTAGLGRGGNRAAHRNLNRPAA